jgi:hypothetical protein
VSGLVAYRFVCHIQLSGGNWGIRPTPAQIRRSIPHGRWHDAVLCRLDFEASDDTDVLLAVEAEFKAYWSPVGAHVEALRDELMTALLQRFQPEFESMVEVEVLDA